MLEDTHVPVTVVNAAVEELGYTTASMVQAIGYDRAIKEPLNEHWRPVYTHGGRRRWVPKTALGRISRDLEEKPDGSPLTTKYHARYKPAADRWWPAHGGEAAKQAALATNRPAGR